MSVNSFTQTGYINPFICEYLVDLKVKRMKSRIQRNSNQLLNLPHVTWKNLKNLTYLLKVLKVIILKVITRCRSTKQRSKSAISTIWLSHRCQIFFVGIAFFFIGKAKAQELYRKYYELEEKAEEDPKVLNTSYD